MKTKTIVPLLAVGLLGGSSCATWEAPENQLTLLRSFEVKGRQGIAVDRDHYYVSGSTSLYRYTKEGQMVTSNEDPFKGYPIRANHIGDIDVHNGELFLSIEWFEDGEGKDIQITVHDAETLAFKRHFPFEPESGQREVSGIAVDRERERIWMCSWVGGESGRHLYEYDLKTGHYLRKLAMNPAPAWIQGVYCHDGALFITADDGDADKNEFDRVYRVSLDPKDEGKTTVFMTLSEVKRVGEIEGLAFDTSRNEWLIHHNRGKRIVRGMPKVFYPGYDREIREVYVFGQ
ncbi:MAG: hypothetical protein AAF492_16175 [Verrucomicrobiota bacterium]